MHGWNTVRRAVCMAGLSLVLQSAQAGADFGAWTDQVVAVAPGSETVIRLEVRNLEPVPLTVRLRLNTDQFSLGPQWVITAAGDCAMPPLFPAISGVDLALAASAVRVCEYRLQRPSNAVHGLWLVFNLDWAGQVGAAPTLSVRAGEVTALHSRQQVLQWAVGDQPGRVRITLRNDGPVPTTRADYALCGPMPAVQPLTVAAGDCEAIGPSGCFTGMLESGLRFGPLAVGSEVSCDVWVRGGRWGGLPLPLDLRGPAGGRMHARDPAQRTLTLRGTPPPQQVPFASIAWLVLLAGGVGLAGWVRLRPAR